MGKKEVGRGKATDPAITTRPEGGATFGDCIVNGIVRIPFTEMKDEGEIEWQEGRVYAHRMLSSSALVRGWRKMSAPDR